MWGCQRGHDLQVKILVDHGIDLHARCTQGQYSGMEGIHVAAMHGHIKIVETLLRCGAMIEEEDTLFRCRPLHFAARSGQSAMVQFLIENGAQIDARACDGRTALHHLARIGDPTSKSIEICRLLLMSGADVNIADDFGDRMLHNLAVFSPNERTETLVAERLGTLVLDQGAEIDAKNKKGLSPLYLAIQSDNRPLSNLLLRSGARELKRTDAVRADVQVTSLLALQTPRYTVNIWRSLNNPKQRWGLSTQSFELSIDDEGYFDMVCEALGDERAVRVRKP